MLFSRRRRWRSAKRRPAPATSASRGRVVGLHAVVVGVFLILSLQLLRMQVIGGSDYRLRADDNRLRVTTSLPPRGLIFDRAGRQLVSNTPVFSVTIVPADVPRRREAEVVGVLQSLLGVPSYEIERLIDRGRRSVDPFAALVVKSEVDHQSALMIAERKQSLPGVEVRYESVRAYSYGQLLGQIVGYAGRMGDDDIAEYLSKGYTTNERVGKAGLELTYQDYLRGTPGRRQVEVDASGKVLRSLAEEAAQAGANLTLSIDIELQRAVTTILRDASEGLASRKTVAMVMDVRTGELLASVSLPTYDNNMFSRQVGDEEYAALLNDPNKPLLNHAIAEKFAPGSTFKMVTGVAALQEGIATPRTTITSKGSLVIPRDYDPTVKDSFPDWHPSLGTLDFYRAIAMSSDIYFYCLAGGNCPELQNGLGSMNIARYARMFGMGERTGIDLPGETAGLIGDAEWLARTSQSRQQWYVADTYYQGIGQGYVETSPLQVLRMTAAVANGGNVLRPRVVREIRAADGTVVKAARPEIVRRVNVDPRNLQVMRDAMRLAVTEGTASKAGVPGVAIAGKTGTAEFGVRLGAGSTYGRYKEHGWVVAFGPFENPEVAVVVFNEEGSGANTAAPTASKILAAYFQQRPTLTRQQP